MVTAGAQTKWHAVNPVADTSCIGVSGIKLFVTAPPTANNLDFLFTRMWEIHANATFSVADLDLMEDVSVAVLRRFNLLITTPWLLHWVFSPVNSTIVS